MKYVFALIALSMFVGCSSGPVMIRVKNCHSIGAGQYECEEIPEEDPFARK